MPAKNTRTRNGQDPSSYNFSFLRRQWRRLALYLYKEINRLEVAWINIDMSYLMVLSVLRRIHWGIGLFCFSFLASFFLIFRVLWAACKKITNIITKPLYFTIRHTMMLHPCSNQNIHNLINTPLTLILKMTKNVK